MSAGIITIPADLVPYLRSGVKNQLGALLDARKDVRGLRIDQRLMLVVRNRRITKVLHPMKEPNHAAGQVLSWREAERGA